jgi:hypothetical protein
LAPVDSDWVDYDAPSASWDPWQEDGGAGNQRTLGEWLEGLVPPEAQLHFFNAGREFAAGIQVTLDHHLHARPGDAVDGEAGSTRIEIE